MSLPAWRKVARPRPEIQDGSFDESVFAVDLGLVDLDTGPPEYLDPIRFLEQTYLTDALCDLLLKLAARLAGDATVPGVYRMQTEFGGGKTHTLLAAYHLFRDPAKVAGTSLVQYLTEQRGALPPRATVAVLDGGAIKPNQDTIERQQVRTLLGRLAYRLGGTSVYTTVAEQDVQRLGSSTEQLVELLRASAPCLILLDETLEYLNKALDVRTGDGNLATTTLIFLKDLVTAVSNVPGAALVATLTSSRLEDYSTLAGQEMHERLSKIFGRTESIVTPVEGDEIFPILRRRLFDFTGSDDDRRAVAHAYADYYERRLGDAIPGSYRAASYRDRLTNAYPFHPELVDILTNRWASLDAFQRTRGALRLLAHTVKALHQHGHHGLLIHPGDVDLTDDSVRAEVLHVTGESYKAALNADIILPAAKASEVERRLGGEVRRLRVATGLATVAFLCSFGPEKARGATTAQLLIGVGQPDLSRSMIEDVRDELERTLWYLRLEQGRYRFLTEPNLNKVLLEREGAIGSDRVDTLLRSTLAEVVPSTPEVHVEAMPIRESRDLPDSPRLTLGILDFGDQLGDKATAESRETRRRAEEILKHHGATFRANQNAAMLVAADANAFARTRGSARALLALRDLAAPEQHFATFNAEQRGQIALRLAAAEERLPAQLVQSYRHLLLMVAGAHGGVTMQQIDLGQPRAGDMVTWRVVEWLRENDRLLSERLSPDALLSAKFGLLPEGTDAVELDTLVGYFARLPRLPKLAHPEVLRDALVEGVRKGRFALVSGSSWDAEDAVVHVKERIDPGEVSFQPGLFLVRATTAVDLLAARGTTLVVPRPEIPPVDSSRRRQTSTSSTTSHPPRPARPGTIPSLTLTINGVPGEKITDLMKSAVLPLIQASIEVHVDLVVHADGGLAGIPRDILSLTVLEGLRQLDLPDVELDPPVA